MGIANVILGLNKRGMCSLGNYRVVSLDLSSLQSFETFKTWR